MKDFSSRCCAILLFGFGLSTVVAESPPADGFAQQQAQPVENPVRDARVELGVLPTYPKRALRNGIDGEVTVRFTIARHGRPVEPEIVRETPRKVFRDNTLDALKYWYISPARSGECTTVEQHAEQTFVFDHAADPKVRLLPIAVEGRATPPRPERKISDIEYSAGIHATEAFSELGDGARLVVTRRVEPVYPEKALQRRKEGFVTVSFLIEKDGSVAEPKVVASSSGAIFKRPALSAIRQWRFEPSYRDGEPIERVACHEFMFNLDQNAFAKQKQKQRERTRLGGF